VMWWSGDVMPHPTKKQEKLKKELKKTKNA
jgi:hypothetical protein